MSSVYCVVTVPTESEERRLQALTCDCGNSPTIFKMKSRSSRRRTNKVAFSEGDNVAPPLHHRHYRRSVSAGVNLRHSESARQTCAAKNRNLDFNECIDGKEKKRTDREGKLYEESCLAIPVDSESEKIEDARTNYGVKKDPCNSDIHKVVHEDKAEARLIATESNRDCEKSREQTRVCFGRNLSVNGSGAQANLNPKYICVQTEEHRFAEDNRSKSSWDGLRELIGAGRRKPQRCYRVRLNVKHCASVERVLRDIIRQLEIPGVFWCRDIDNCMLQARFTIVLDEKYERLIMTLHEWGIGERLGTSISVMNCTDTKCSAYTHQIRARGSVSAWERFMDSVRCRLNVNHVVRKVQHEATITFDFLVLLVAAAVLACFGLVENSQLFLSSSMLISPLMGPIIAGVFGTVIRDHKLRLLGFRNELFGIAFATFVGLFFGLVVCFMGQFFVISDGLTQEIMSRCETRSLSVGFFTALASGAAGAIGVLGGNIGSLVGVAISASLLPPAVNSGLLWALALGTPFFSEENRMLKNLVKEKIYSHDQSVELIIYASISMGLTLLNIVCVWVMGVLVLRVKEIAPHIRSENEKFWKHDIKVARQTSYDTENQKKMADKKRRGLNDITNTSYQHTWSPGSKCTEYPTLCGGRHYHTVHGLDEISIKVYKKEIHTLRSPSPEPINAGITVMELFAQGPLDDSKSSTYDNSEISKMDNATEMTITPTVSGELLTSTENNTHRALIQYVRPMRASFGSLSNTSSLCIVDECKHNITWSNLNTFAKSWQSHATTFHKPMDWLPREKDESPSENDDYEQKVPTNREHLQCRYTEQRSEFTDDDQKPCTSTQAQDAYCRNNIHLHSRDTESSSSFDDEYEV